MTKTIKTILKKSIGVVLIILGLLILLTPLTPGSWLALVGLELLGLRILFQKKLSILWHWLKKR